ncbi:MAG: response regulator transcription factor [Lysobacterales bacterium]|nr:MAG: response regulator transcription factor [Xanthomonadales bacterium]
MNRKRVLLADDHAMFHEGLEKLLSPTYKIAGRVQDGRSLVEAAVRLMPELIVADISMPELNGIEAIREMKSAGVDATVVLLTMHEDPDYAIEALQEGALGYVVKHSASSELLFALEEALSGRMYVSPRVAKEVFARISSANQAPAKAAREPTPRQREVLRYLAKGCSAKEIARCLGVSQRTVEHHKYNMMAQMGIKTTAGLIQYAVKQGMIE